MIVHAKVADLEKRGGWLQEIFDCSCEYSSRLVAKVRTSSAMYAAVALCIGVRSGRGSTLSDSRSSFQHCAPGAPFF
jgi:hypothetical protein